MTDICQARPFGSAFLVQLSLGGKLALAFGSLMEKLWRGGVSHVSPKLFKWQLSKFAPQFSGYAQQDSQVGGLSNTETTGN
jgi:ubiquitin C-terminal hydrolase